MHRNSSPLSAGCAAAAILLAIGPGSAPAQERSRQVMEEVVVVAPRLVRHAERTSTGGRIEHVSLTRRVSIGDLDLRLHADVQELEKRIHETAAEACEYLAEMFPLASPDTPDCVDEALDGAMAQAREAIAAANP